MTLRELNDAYLEQYDAAPATRVVAAGQHAAGARRRSATSRSASSRRRQIATWRQVAAGGQALPAHRALRQVLAGGGALEVDRGQPGGAGQEPGAASRARSIRSTSWEEIDAIGAELDAGATGALVVFLGGTGVRPEEAFGAEWRDVDLEGGMFTRAPRVREGPAEGLRQDDAARGARCRCARATVDGAGAAAAPQRDPVPAPAGGRIDINNWRHRCWTPALAAAGVEHRRIYDLRHTYATWSLAAGIDIFTLARRMGTSVKMIDRTYGHLAAGADDYERELLDAYDARSAAFRRCVGAGTAGPGARSG